MMTKYKLYRLAEKHKIPIISVRLYGGIEVIAVLNDDGRTAIGIDYEQVASEADETYKLAHELGHCETGAFYNRYSNCDIVSRHEYRADKWAIKKLLPKSEMEEAFMHGYVEVWQLADYFEAPEELIKKALWIYFDKAA